MATLKKLLPPVNWQWQQTMLRVKDSKASTAYYCEHYGMTLICFLDFPEWSFDLSFLASLPEEQTYDLDPASAEAKAYCFGGVYGGHGNVCLELTHNYGTEAEAGKVYHAGNAMEAAGQDGLHPAGRDGFGHVAFNCDDVYAKRPAIPYALQFITVLYHRLFSTDSRLRVFRLHAPSWKAAGWNSRRNPTRAE